MFRLGNRTSHLDRMKNSSYYIAPVGDRTHDIPHTVASNMVNVSHALNHSATAAELTFSRPHYALSCYNSHRPWASAEILIWTSGEII